MFSIHPVCFILNYINCRCLFNCFAACVLCLWFIRYDFIVCMRNLFYFHGNVWKVQMSYHIRMFYRFQKNVIRFERKFYSFWMCFFLDSLIVHGLHLNVYCCIGKGKINSKRTFRYTRVNHYWLVIPNNIVNEVLPLANKKKI